MASAVSGTVFGKRIVIPKMSNTKMRKLGELVHSDFCRPLKIRSIQSKMYMDTYLDNKTG